MVAIPPPPSVKPNLGAISALPGFLKGGGEMGARMRAHDWSESPLGWPADWPAPLRTAVRLLLNTGHPMYIFWGLQGGCLYNDAYRQSLGPEYHPGSLGCRAAEVWAEIWDVIGPQIAQVMAGDGATWHENQLVPITRNGRRERVYWTYSYGPIDDESTLSGVGGVLVVCSETTATVLAKQRQAEQTARQRRLFACAPGFIAILCGPTHIFEFVNESYSRLTGGRDLIGVPVAIAFPEVAGQGFLDLLDQVFRSGERFAAHHIPIWFDHPDKPERVHMVLDFIYEPITEANGEVSGIFVEGYDVTEQHRAQEALRELNATLEQRVLERTADRDRLWELSDDLLVLADYDARLLRVSPSWTRLLGFVESSLLGRDYAELLHPGDLAALQQALIGMRASQCAVSLDHRVLAADGSWRWVAWRLSPEPGGLRLNGVGRDMTEARAWARELESTQEALRQAQKMEAVGQLTGGLAHDFNNLLTGITGSLELLQTRVGQGRIGELHRYIDAAQGAARRAAALTHRLLAFARRQSLDPRAIDLNQLVGGMEELICRTMGPGVEVVIHRTVPLSQVRADSNQIENALLNLCINARDAMQTAGRLRIETAEIVMAEAGPELAAGAYVELWVIDDGPGMPAEVIARAFEPFFTTKPLGQGTGLGLSMVYGFARQSGGAAEIRSTPGEGTRICLRLPRYCGELEVIAPPVPPLPPFRGGGQRVLVVDDEETVRMLVREVLIDLGYVAIEAADGASGLAALRAHPGIDLLITDIGLPGGMTGRDLADMARVLRAGLPVLFITAYAAIDREGEPGLPDGMEVMAKPFDVATLTARLQAALA